MHDLKVFIGQRLDGSGQQFSMRFNTLGQQIDHLGCRVNCLEGDMGSLRSYLGLPKYVHPGSPSVPTTPTTFHPMPCLNPEDCDTPSAEDDENAADEDGA